jgi:hypothetical protein
MVKKTKTRMRKETVRFYPGPDDDLIAWLQTLDELPFGGRAQAIREMLRRGLGHSAQATPAAPAAVDLSGWLPEIRRALAAELDQRQLTASGTTQAAVGNHGEASEAEALLDQLTANLILEA